MPRIARNLYTNNFFHVITQGIKKEPIFQKNYYKKKYVNILLHKLEGTDVKLVAYCIMDNHAHHLMYTDHVESISKLMRSINTAYAIYYNKQENRVGYVFRNRFVSEPILDQKHLYSCLSYIHHNPVKANMVSNLQDYPYSSYNQFIKHSGIVSDNILQLIFESSLNYLPTFLAIHKITDANFLDIENDVHVEDTISSFLEEKNLSFDQVIQIPFLLKDLILKLHKENHLSERKIAELLHISRYTPHKILEKID